jgi:CRP/FNR family transcriptional regulator
MAQKATALYAMNPPSCVDENVELLLRRVGRSRLYGAGQTIFAQGNVCTGVHLVIDGMIGLRRVDEEGNSALLSLAGPDDVIGYRAFLAMSAHSNAAEALTHCEVLFLELTQLSQLLKQSPSVREYFVQKALEDLDRIQVKCAALLTEGLRSRFIKLLLQIRDICHPNCTAGLFEIELPIQRKEIAALLGVAPGSLSRLLSDLEEEGLISINGRTIEFEAAAGTVGYEARSEVLPVWPSSTIFESLIEARRALLSMLDARDVATRRALYLTVQSASRRLDRALCRPWEPFARETLAFKNIWEDFKRTRQTEIIPALMTGKTELARKIATGIQAERMMLMTSILSRGSRCSDSLPSRDCGA